MSIPKYNELYKPLLSTIQDGQTHSLKEVQGKVAAAISLSEPDQIAALPSGQKIFYNRINWANTYLKKAGLIASPKRGYIEITAEGKSLFSSGVEITKTSCCWQTIHHFGASKTGRWRTQQKKEPMQRQKMWPWRKPKRLARDDGKNVPGAQ